MNFDTHGGGRGEVGFLEEESGTIVKEAPDAILF